MASDVIDIRERIERVREAVQNSAALTSEAAGQPLAAAANLANVAQTSVAASKPETLDDRADKTESGLAKSGLAKSGKSKSGRAQSREQSAEIEEVEADEELQALQLNQMVAAGTLRHIAGNQLAEAPSIKLNIKSQRINRMLMVMLAVQILSNFALIYLVYQLQG